MTTTHLSRVNEGRRFSEGGVVFEEIEVEIS